MERKYNVEYFRSPTWNSKELWCAEPVTELMVSFFAFLHIFLLFLGIPNPPLMHMNVYNATS